MIEVRVVVIGNGCGNDDGDKRSCISIVDISI
jgi:hypothetical protein